MDEFWREKMTNRPGEHTWNIGGSRRLISRPAGTCNPGKTSRRCRENRYDRPVLKCSVLSVESVSLPE
jgi:hypothetical protein